MKKHCYVDIHVIQTVPPSCVNRDDTGSPKTAIYGGVKRARVSSQAWKRAARLYFGNECGHELGNRTRKYQSWLADEIHNISSDLSQKDAMKKASDVFKMFAEKENNREKKDEVEDSKTLLFISLAQIKALAALAVEGETDKAKYKSVLNDNPTLDIILFGRMVAKEPSLNYDAVVQVAHAISTHEVDTEYDYFTAVDDRNKNGAGFLSVKEFNSSTLYRYATVNVSELYSKTDVNTAKVVRDFTEAFIYSMPTGMQNSFANGTLPDMVYITFREDQPVNLSGAFEKAVKSGKDGFVEASCKSLLAYAGKVYSTFADAPVQALGCGTEDSLSDYAEVLPKKAMLERLEAYTAEKCGEDNV